jgi:hypothetical protein
MFRQIIVAMAGAIAAQLTAAGLDLSPADRRDHFAPQTASPLTLVTGAPQNVFAMPASVATIASFLGPTQIANGE